MRITHLHIAEVKRSEQELHNPLPHERLGSCARVPFAHVAQRHLERASVAWIDDAYAVG